MKVLFVACGILLAINSLYCEPVMEVTLNDMMTDEAQVCNDFDIQFTCTLTESAYDWVALPFLNGSVGNGRVTIGTTVTVGNFTLSASGSGSGRRSTLQVTAFPGLNGVNILCREAEGDPTVNQNANITVLGNPSAPIISDVSSRRAGDQVLFDLVVDPPVNNVQCVKSYIVTVNEVNTTEFPVEQRPPVRQNITVNTEDVAGTKPCQRNHGFIVRASNSNEESEAVDGSFNYSTSDFGFRGNATNVSIVIDVPLILQSCVYGYEYTYLNNTSNYTGSPNMIPLSLFDNSTQCRDEECRVTITPIIIMRTILTNSQFVVYLNNATPPTTIPTDADTTIPSMSSVPVPIIAGVVGGVGGVILILLLVIIGLILFKKLLSAKSKGETERPLQPKANASVDTQEALPTYQDPSSIKRETATQSGDVYTVPQKKPQKGNAKKGQNEDLPMYSVVDKSTKHQEGLVYADIDVKNPVKPRSRPPAPPGVTEHDPNEPVVYSVVQK